MSSSFGGFYFGEILGGMSQVTTANNGRMIAIQTLDAGTVTTDLAEPPGFRHRVAWDHISAFAVILNAVNVDYLQAARAAGKPIVMISDSLPGFSCPTVLPDNTPGTREAVEHLIEHGHVRIGYVGNPVQKDIHERYQAYCETLREHGIEPDPALFYNTGNNQESGGELAARAMIENGLPSTTVVTAMPPMAVMKASRASATERP